MKVRNLMHKGVEIMTPDTPVTKLAKKMREKDIGAIPVGSNGKLVGMVTDRDITVRAVAKGKDLTQLTAQDVMTKGVVCCRDTDKVRDVLHIMEEKQIRRVAVTNSSLRLARSHKLVLASPKIRFKDLISLDREVAPQKRREFDMPIWQLTPIDLDDPSWEASSHRGPAIIRAASEGAAREIAQEAFGVKTGFRLGDGIIAPPWKRAGLVRAEKITDPRYEKNGPSELLSPTFES